MAIAHAPAFYFKIDYMSESPDHVPNQDRSGRWCPPKASGRNIIAGLGPSFYCDGTSITQVSQIPSNAAEYRTYSIYYDQGVFWTFNYDATRYQVGDGIDNDGGRHPAGPRDDNYPYSWHTLSFEHPEGATTSTVCYAGDRTRLRSQNQNQRWVPLLLPSAYHANTTTGQGGLNGELPLIIALLAFSIDYRQIRWMFENCFQNGSWTAQLHSGNHGRVDRRGMVVRVFSCPPYSTNDHLFAYEHGAYGTIFP